MNTIVINTIGWISGFLFVIMAIPQLIKTFKTRDVKDLSIATWWLYTIALCLSVTYLACQSVILWPVLVNQSISAVLGAMQIGAIYYFR